MEIDIEKETQDFNNQNQQSVDKIKTEMVNLKQGLQSLNLSDDKLHPFLKQLNDFEEMYSKRLSNWKGILETQRRFHKQKLENMPEKLQLKDTKQKEHFKQQTENLQQQNEKIKALKEELAVLKIAMQSYSLYEKKYFAIKYRYDELKNNTGNF